MADLSKVIYINEDDYSTLLNGGTITKDGVTYSYDATALYVIKDISAPEYAETAGHANTAGTAGTAGTATNAVNDSNGNNIAQTYSKKPLIIEIDYDGQDWAHEQFPQGTYSSITTAISQGRDVIVKLSSDDYAFTSYFRLIQNNADDSLYTFYAGTNQDNTGIVSLSINVYDDLNYTKGISLQNGNISTGGGNITTSTGSISTTSGSISTTSGGISTTSGGISTSSGSIITTSGGNIYTWGVNNGSNSNIYTVGNSNGSGGNIYATRQGESGTGGNIYTVKGYNATKAGDIYTGEGGDIKTGSGGHFKGLLNTDSTASNASIYSNEHQPLTTDTTAQQDDTKPVTAKNAFEYVKSVIADQPYSIIAEKTFDPYTITAADQVNGYIFFMNVVPTSDNYYEPWKIKYRLSITTENQYIQGIYDCELGSAGTSQQYSIFNRFYSTSYYPSYYHLMAWHSTAAKYANRSTNPIKIGERIWSAASATTVARTFTIQVIETKNCTVSFPDDIETYGDVYTDDKYGYCTELNATSVGLMETGDTNYQNYYNYEYYTSYRIHGVDTPLYRYKYCGFDEKNRLVPITNTNQTNDTIVTKTPTNVPMVVSKGLIYYNSTTAKTDVGAIVATATIYRNTSVSNPLVYNFNTAISSGTDVYLVGSYDPETDLFTLDSTSTNSYYLYASNADPTTYLSNFTSGKYYWLIGNTTGAYVNFLIDNPLMYFDGTNLISVNAASYNSLVDYVDEQIGELPNPMIFKGTVGTGGTVSWVLLPIPSSANEGWTYKVITAHATQVLSPTGDPSAQGWYELNSATNRYVLTTDTSVQSGKTYYMDASNVGDTIISNGTDWVVIPSGDEPGGTVTNVAITGTSPISVSGSPITSSGTISITHATSGATAGSYGDSSAQTPAYGGTFKVPYVTVNNTGHITGISEHTVTIPAMGYWANLHVRTDALYNEQPEFKEVKINGSTSGSSASTENCVMQYDTTNKCVKFVFNS